MIHEYALEPSLVAGWGERSAYRYFIASFGVGTRRVVCNFPKAWKREVWNSEVTRALSEVDKTRLEVLLTHLGERVTRRVGYEYDKNSSWTENALAEDTRKHFHQILRSDNVDDQLDGSGREKWHLVNSIIVPRTAQDMTSAMAPMLSIAKRIILIDPYFRADAPRFVKVLSSFMDCAAQNRDSPAELSIEIHTGTQVTDYHPLGLKWQFFESDCRRTLPSLVPAGASLRIVRWSERPGGQELHNRYVLSEYGGVMFGAGLVEGTTGTSDELKIMDTDVYLRRWREYGATGDPSDYAFDLENTCTLIGTKVV